MGVVTLVGYLLVRDRFSQFDDATFLRRGFDFLHCVNGKTRKRRLTTTGVKPFRDVEDARRTIDLPQSSEATGSTATSLLLRMTCRVGPSARPIMRDTSGCARPHNGRGPCDPRHEVR